MLTFLLAESHGEMDGRSYLYTSKEKKKKVVFSLAVAGRREVRTGP